MTSLTRTAAHDLLQGQIDLGVEYRHGDRELVSGADGQLDRLEFAAKYNF